MADKALSGNLKAAEEIHYKYYPLFEALRWETNPMAAKAALNLMGLPGGGLRMPLTPLSDEKTQKMKGILQKLKLIGS